MLNWRFWRNLSLFSLIIVGVGAISALLFLGYQGAHNYLHPNRYQRPVGDVPSKDGTNFQDITITTQDGINLAAWYTPAKNGALILVIHGYGGARSTQLHSFFAEHGYGVISWDARTHGESDGDICTFGYYEKFDVKAAIDFAMEMDSSEHIGAYGESMGGATLIIAAAEFPQIQALIVDSPYANIADMLNVVVPYPWLRPFIKFFVELETGLDVDEVRPEISIRAISPRPVLIIQGDADETVPPQSATIIYEAAGDPKQLWIEPGVGHVGTYAAYPDKFEKHVIDFFDQYLLDN